MLATPVACKLASCSCSGGGGGCSLPPLPPSPLSMGASSARTRRTKTARRTPNWRRPSLTAPPLGAGRAIIESSTGRLWLHASGQAGATRQVTRTSGPVNHVVSIWPCWRLQRGRRALSQHPEAGRRKVASFRRHSPKSGFAATASFAVLCRRLRRRSAWRLRRKVCSRKGPAD